MVSNNALFEYLTPSQSAEGEKIISNLASMPGALVSIFHALQQHFGFIDSGFLPIIARSLNLSRAEVYGVVSFYHDFRQKPPARQTIHLCRAEACQAQGCEQMIVELVEKFGLTMDENSGEVELRSVYCLGNCALGPSAMVGQQPLGRVSAQTIAEICSKVMELPV